MDFGSNINLHKNKLQEAKLEIIDREFIENDDVIDKQFVDDSQIYSTELSNVSTGVNSGKPIAVFGGITLDTVVDGKTNSELWDLALYPLQHPMYVQPSITFTSSILDQNTLSPISAPYEVGQSVLARLSVSSVFNDSQGLQGTLPYSWSGTGISGTATTGLSTVDVNLDMLASNSWSNTTVFQGSAIKNDTHGNPDSTGIFGVVSKTATSSKTAYWPYWISVNNGNISAPSNQTTLRALSGKVLGSLPTTFTVIIPAGSTQTLIISVASLTANISMIKDGAQPIASGAIQKSTILNVQSIGTSGQTNNYTVFRHDNGVGYAVQSVYTVTITY